MSQADVQPISSESVDHIAERAQSAFRFSLIFSAVRCTLQYVILPFVLPMFGIAGAVAVPFLLAINMMAIVSILYSVRRFWQINYRYKWHYLAFSVVMLVILASFIASDIIPETF